MPNALTPWEKLTVNWGCCKAGANVGKESNRKEERWEVAGYPHKLTKHGLSYFKQCFYSKWWSLNRAKYESITTLEHSAIILYLYTSILY